MNDKPPNIPDLHVEVRLRNNQLLVRRRAQGLTQKAVAAAAGITVSACSGLETLRLDPRNAQGAWRPCALRLAVYYQCLPEDLFPESLDTVKQSTAETAVSVEAALALMGGAPQHLVEAPIDAALDMSALRETVVELLDTLSPRQAAVMSLRFGLDGDELTLRKIGARLGISMERVRQIEKQAYKKLRHPTRLKYLRAHRDGAPVPGARCAICHHRHVWRPSVKEGGEDEWVCPSGCPREIYTIQRAGAPAGDAPRWVMLRDYQLPTSRGLAREARRLASQHERAHRVVRIFPQPTVVEAVYDGGLHLDAPGVPR